MAKGAIFKVLIFSFLFCLFLPAVAFSEVAASSAEQDKEYGVDEFPKPLNDLRRFEQVLFGSFPLAIFFAQLAGGAGLWIDSLITSSRGGYSDFAFGIENYKFDDKVRIIASGVGISFGIAVIDMIIYQVKQKELNEKYKRKKVLTKNLSGEIIDASSEKLYTDENSLNADSATSETQELTNNSLALPKVDFDSLSKNYSATN